MPSNGLTQNAQGRWDLTIKHEGPAGLTIPARLTYDGQQESISIVSSDRTYNTAWYTELGTPINTNEIDKYAKPTLYNGKTYVVKDWIFDVRPYDESGTTGETTFRLRVSPKSDSIDSAGTIQILAYYEELSGSTVVSSQEVTSLSSCFWASSNSNVASVSGGWVQGKNKNSGSSQTVTITATYSGHSDTSSITVAKASGSTPTEDYLVFTPTSKTVGSGVTSFTLIVSSNTTWTAGPIPTVGWVDMDYNSGTGVKNVTVTVATNNTASARTATIKGYIGTTEKAICYLTQEANGGGGDTNHKLEVTPVSTSITHNGTVQLTAKYYTKTNGAWDSGVDVTNNSNCVWSTSDSSHATVSHGLVTGNNTSTAEDFPVTISAVYSNQTGTSVVTVLKQGGGNVSYVLEIFADPMEIQFNGESQLSAEYVTLVDGTETSRVSVSPDEVTWTITYNVNYATIDPETGILTPVNIGTSYNRWIKVKGEYNNVESDEVSIYVHKEPSIEFFIEPNSTGIGAFDTFQFIARYQEYEDGELVTDLVVTDEAEWSANSSSLIFLNKGSVSGNNETFSEQLVMLEARYGGRIAYASLTLGPNPDTPPEDFYYLLSVEPNNDSIDYNGDIYLAAKLYTYRVGETTPVAQEIVTNESNWYTSQANDGAYIDSQHKGHVIGNNHQPDPINITITATYQPLYSEVGYSGTSIITVGGKDIAIDVDTRPITLVCEDEYTATRQITASSQDLTWKTAAVDPEQWPRIDVDWATVSPSSGVGDGEITITVNGANTGKTIRDCHVWIYYPVDGSNYKEVYLSQYPTPRFSLASRTIQAPSMGLIEKIYVNTNYELSLDNNGNNWITLGQEESGNGYAVIITVDEATAESGSRTGTIYVGSNYSGDCDTFDPEPVAITIEQEYEPPVPPEEDGKIFIYETETSTHRNVLSYNINAAEQVVEFYFSSNTNCVVAQHTNGITVTEANGDDLTDGQTIVPTSTTKRKLLIHVPMNITIGQGKTHIIGLETSGGSGAATINIQQGGNSVNYYDDYDMVFLVEDMMPGQDEVDITSASRYILPEVRVTAVAHYSAGYTSTVDMEDYIDNAGVVDNKMSLTISDPAVIKTNDHTHGGAYQASKEHPYELWFPANQTVSPTGTVRDVVLTLTYQGQQETVSKTVTVHQQWSQKPIEPVDIHMQSGSPVVLVDTANVTAGTSNTNKYIHLEPNSTSIYFTGETGVTLYIFTPYDMSNMRDYVEVNGNGLSWEENSNFTGYTGTITGNGLAVTFTNKQSSGSYMIGITGSKTGCSDKNLTLNVTCNGS